MTEAATQQHVQQNFMERKQFRFFAHLSVRLDAVILVSLGLHFACFSLNNFYGIKLKNYRHALHRQSPRRHHFGHPLCVSFYSQSLCADNNRINFFASK